MASSTRTVFVPLAAVALVAAGVWATTSFAADATATGGAPPNRIVALGETTPLPESVAGLPHGHAPELRPGAGVATPGDVVLVDTRREAEPLAATLYVTNLAEVRRSYVSVVLPVAVWRAEPNGWRRLPGERFVTDADGRLDLTVPSGGLFVVTVEEGGALVARPGAAAAAGADLMLVPAQG